MPAGAPRSSAVSPTTSSTKRVVDGAINGIAVETGAAGGELRKVQSGRVQRYALILFAGVGLLGLAIFLVNIA